MPDDLTCEKGDLLAVKGLTAYEFWKNILTLEIWQIRASRVRQVKSQAVKPILSCALQP